MTDRCLIYVIRNRINDKVYVGQTWHSTKKRCNGWHGYRNGTPLKNAIKELGKDNFYYQELCTTTTQANADYLERYFIKLFNSFENGYNATLGGMAYGTHSETTKKIMSEKSKINTKGEKNSRAILTLEDVENIRNSTIAERKICKLYGVFRSTINSVRRRINWK